MILKCSYYNAKKHNRQTGKTSLSVYNVCHKVMDLWHKLFTIRKKNDQNKSQKSSTEKCDSPCVSSGEGAPFNLQKDGIRVLLFRECDKRGRKLLYDSKTVVRIPIAESASAGISSCKTMFKGGKHSGSFVTSSAGSSPASITHPTSKKSFSSHVKLSSSTSGSKSDSFVEINGGYGYQYQQPEGDTKQLGEFVFGTVALAYKGSYSKLHILQEPQRVLFSRSSPAPRSYVKRSCTSSDQGIEDSSFSSSLSSLSEAVMSRTESLDMAYGHGLHSSNGVGPSWGIDMPHMLSTSHSEGDSGFGGPPSPYSSTCGSFLSPPSLPNTPLGTPSSRQGSGSSLKHSGSLNSLQRRFLRNVTTSLEALGRDGESEDSRMGSGHQSHRTTRLGLAVILDIGTGYTELSKQVEDWLFLHLSVIEASINRLQSSLDAAYLHSKTFASTTHQAVTQLQKDMIDLASGPRLCRPVWLGLLGKSSSCDRQLLCTQFVDTLASILSTFDTKQTNFFVSKLLTAVLTHHLGWVSTVVPGDYLPQSSRSASSSRSGSYSTPSQIHLADDNSVCDASWMERLNESHPYSAVWAQLCELSGAVGYPPRAARTILVGSNSDLLSQLLTILSYIIRCSQITEQDIHPHKFGENSTPDRQQPCFSRTSSVASVVTIVEGGLKDGQPQSQRRNSSAKLHRDSSIRRSWRLNRENRSSRFYPQDCRNNSSESTTEMAKGHNSSDEQVASVMEKGNRVAASNQSSNRKEKETSSRWMLNDDVEIVISGEKSSETKDNSLNTMTIKELGHTGEVQKTLSTCKTSNNLALLIDDDSEASLTEPSLHSLNEDKCKVFPEPSSGLYPSLLDLDDHRETFGAVSLEPGVISQKVQKLFRPPSKCSVSMEPSHNFDQVAQSSSCGVNFKSLDNDSVMNTKVDSASIHSTGSNTLFSSCAQQRALVSDSFPSHSDNSPIKVLSPKSLNNERKSPNKVIPAIDIKPEIEEGGKVLFLLGENERIEGLKRHTKSVTDQHSDRTEPSWVSLGPNNTPVIGFERFDNLAKLDRKNIPSERSATPPMESEPSRITSVPSPVDNRRIVRTRNVGRESALDLTSFEKENVVYPSLSELKKNTNHVRLFNVGKKEMFTKTHRRYHSDPVNGNYNSKLTLAFPQPLKDVMEEHSVVDNKCVGRKKAVSCGSDQQRTSDCLKSDTSKTKLSDADGIQQTIPSVESQSVIDATDNSAKNSSPTDEAPLVLEMPRISCLSNPQRTPVCDAPHCGSLAWSLLGGVLDHYSSVFILHATTQSSHLEEMLRQDLSAAAHHSTLDPQVSEAVAVVADTDSWEVQVASSHSFVVERGGCGNQIGIRVGMSPLVSAITDSILDLTRLSVDPQFIVQHLEERLCELYLKSQLLAEYLLSGASFGFGGSETSFSPYHLPELTRALGLDLNDLPLLLAVASTHTPALTRMFGISIK